MPVSSHPMRDLHQTAGGCLKLRATGEEAAGGRLLTERNVRMAARLQARLKEGGAFVAVGALHLHGESGVLAELERRGWKVTRVY
jgi:uncharacterized protein YbaP (TraB family)